MHCKVHYPHCNPTPTTITPTTHTGLASVCHCTHQYAIEHSWRLPPPLLLWCIIKPWVLYQHFPNVASLFGGELHLIWLSPEARLVIPLSKGWMTEKRKQPSHPDLIGAIINVILMGQVHWGWIYHLIGFRSEMTAIAMKYIHSIYSHYKGLWIIHTVLKKGDNGVFRHNVSETSAPWAPQNQRSQKCSFQTNKSGRKSCPQAARWPPPGVGDSLAGQWKVFRGIFIHKTWCFPAKCSILLNNWRIWGGGGVF